jgi:hypothetical protein
MGTAALASASRARNVWVSGGNVGGNAGAQITLAVPVPPGAHVMQARLDSSGIGGGTLRVDCGEGEVDLSPVDAESALAVPARGGRCIVHVLWRRSDWTVQSLRISPFDSGPENVAGRIWVPKGVYRFHVYATPVREAEVAAVRIDGKPALNAAVRLCTGWHDVLMQGVAPDAYALAAFANGTPAARPHAPLQAHRISATSFNVALSQRSTVEAAVLSDGNWRAKNTETGAVIVGRRCDVFETCFPGLSPGRYEIFHAWPLALVAGTAISLAAIFLSCATALLALAYQKRASREKVFLAEANF